jgi:type IV pilus assembly protein PilA
MPLVDRCRQRHVDSEGGDEGFTLIELLVVLLIIGILLAIAIPTYLSITKGANNTAAQSNLQTALTGAKAYFTQNNQTYTGITNSTSTSTIQQIDTGVNYVTGTTPSSEPHQVWIGTSADGTSVLLAAYANGSQDCWGIFDDTAANGTSEVIDGVTVTSSGTTFLVQHNSSGTRCGKSAFSSPSTATTGFPHA